MYFLLTTLLACVCFAGDHILQISNTNLSKAVVDSSTHCLVAILSWLIVLLKCHKRSTMLINSIFELLLCGFLATSIDVDHFIQARSLKLKIITQGAQKIHYWCSLQWIEIAILYLYTKHHFLTGALTRRVRYKADALSLGKKRPVLHCTTLPVVVLLTCLAVGFIIDSPRVLRFGWLSWVALFSHHIRDSSRRGLWLWPLGSSPPLPYYIYLCATLALPYLVIIPLSSRTASDLTTDYAQYTV